MDVSSWGVGELESIGPGRFKGLNISLAGNMKTGFGCGPRSGLRLNCFKCAGCATWSDSLSPFFMKIQGSFPLKQSPADKIADQDGKLRDAAKMYETHFLNHMVKAMRKTATNEDGLIKQNMAEKIFSEQLDNQYVDNWANKGGVGLADMIYTQIHDKYFGTTKKDFGQRGALPIAPATQKNGLRATDSIQMKTLPAGEGAKFNYRFEVTDPSGGQFDAQVPMEGVVKQSQKLGDGWNLVRLDHGRGIESEMTFPGSIEDLSPGTALEAGQKLGTLDSARPVLAWKLDWNQG